MLKKKHEHHIFMLYTMIQKMGRGGTTYPTTGSYTYYSSIFCTAYPNTPAYKFSHWTATGPVTNLLYWNNPLSESFTGDIDLTAVFQPVSQYTITVQSEDTIRGTASGSGSCYAGGYIPVSASPESGWQFEGWYLNGSKISGSASFNYSPSASCTLIAKFNLHPSAISGPSPALLCHGSGNAKTFSTSYWQAGFSWGKSSNISLIGGTTSSSVSAAGAGYGDGPGWVSIISNGTELGRYNVWVGGTTITGIGTDGGDLYYAELPTNTLVDVASFSTFNWTITQTSGSGGYCYVSPYSGTNYAVAYVSGPGTYLLECTVTNVCTPGSFFGNYASYWIYGSRSPSSVYPNPVSDILNVEIDRQIVLEAQKSGQNTTGARRSNLDPTFDIRLYDMIGNQLRQTTTKGGKVQFNVSNLANGFYFLHIYDGINDKPEVRSIIVKH